MTGYRNGSRTRTLTGTFGKTEITVPRARLKAGDGTTPEFILDQPPYHFAAYVRGVTDRALSIRIPPTDMNRYPRMTPAEHDTVRQRLRTAYAAPRDMPPPAATGPDKTARDTAAPQTSPPENGDDWRS